MPGTAGCGLLHPLIVVAMTLGVPTDCRGPLKQLPGVGVHAPALPTLPIHSHLALEREKRRPWRIPCSCQLSLCCSSLRTEPGVRVVCLHFTVHQGDLLKCSFPFRGAEVSLTLGIANTKAAGTGCARLLGTLSDGKTQPPAAGRSLLEGPVWSLINVR